MLRNVKFNLLSWLYTLTLLSLSLSIIITFWLLLSLALQILLPELLTLIFPLLSLIAKSSFLEAYNLSMNPDAGGDPGIEGSGGAAGGSGGAGGSGRPGGSNPDYPWLEKKRTTRYANNLQDPDDDSSIADDVDPVPPYTGENKKEFIESLKPLRDKCKVEKDKYKFIVKRTDYVEDNDPKNTIEPNHPNFLKKVNSYNDKVDKRIFERETAYNKFNRLYMQYINQIEEWDENNPGKLTKEDWKSFLKNASERSIKKDKLNSYLDDYAQSASE